MRNTSTIIAVSIIGLITNRGMAIEGAFESELIFPLHHQHNHAAGIVELPDGDLLVSWYRGSGERKSDDVAVYGSRYGRSDKRWSDAFLMADTPGFPDCNTCMMVDRSNRVWLFWPTIIANSWESCITNYLVTSKFNSRGEPKWQSRGTILLKPDDFSQQANSMLDGLISKHPEMAKQIDADELQSWRDRLGDKLYQRLGWQPRCKPTVLPSGRIILPLYSDTYSFSLMAISDDEGETWFASKPLMGFGNIQPVVLRRNNGTLVAYMRENGPRQRIRVSESEDDGVSWGPVGESDLPNPGAGVDGVRLANGHWAIVYNDTTKGRNSLAISISHDEGRTWPKTAHLEQKPSGSYHYPAVIQAADGRIHVVYSYFVDGGKSMKHVSLDEAWVLENE